MYGLIGVKEDYKRYKWTVLRNDICIKGVNNEMTTGRVECENICCADPT